MLAYRKFFGLLALALAPFFVAVWAVLTFIDGDLRTLVGALLVLVVTLGTFKATEELPLWLRMTTRLVAMALLVLLVVAS